MDTVVHEASERQGECESSGNQQDVQSTDGRADSFIQGDNWNDLLKEVVTFNSVEEFWGIYVWGTSTLELATRNC